MNDKHPVAYIAEPATDDTKRAAVALVWSLRENLGNIERLLQWDSKDVGPHIIEQICDNGGLARGSALICRHAGAGVDVEQLLHIANLHCKAASSHLENHFAYAALLSRPQGNQHERLTELGTNERVYASRASQMGRQAAHRALAKLVEFWPDSYRREDD
jgi:hypothetical protein